MSSGIGATVINRAAHSHAIPIAKVVLVLTLAHAVDRPPVVRFNFVTATTTILALFTTL
ncbi:hypothetical protein T4B_10270 [Trichinella pseudospiralis]|uniref:Uncharacterized protein n=1 Tax=Trichinella pseudospiralis TaxID=6337 RepID=A0A0V1JF95_TRIPS|nr:hypothetical protein T4B_10270 [Trichinella pseudospiralis]